MFFGHPDIPELLYKFSAEKVKMSSQLEHD